MADPRLKSDTLKVIEEGELQTMYDNTLNNNDFICLAKAIPNSYKPINLKRPKF